MPREIVNISVGQCGNQIGHEFWKRILSEHNIKNDGTFDMHSDLAYEDLFKLDKIEVYFDEWTQDKYVPRTVLIDLEPGVIEKVLSSQIGPLFKPDHVLTRASGAGNNWAKGHYTLGNEIINETMDIIRLNVEACEQLQGFQLSHSIGGGTGSGLGTLILEKLKDAYPDRLISSWSIYPTPKVSDVVVEPYNALLSIAPLILDTDLSFVIDNEALFNISHKILKQKNPSFADLNWIMSQTMAGCTASLRFPGILNCDLRKMAVNLIPFPKLHFFTSSYAPLHQIGSPNVHCNWSLRHISNKLWSPKCFLSSTKSGNGVGKFLSASCIYRGRNISSQEIEDLTRKHLDRESQSFVEWIPHNVKTAIINVKPEDNEFSATMIGNVTSIKDSLERIWHSFDKLFKRKAFLHWYRNEGIHEMEFIEAEKEIKELIMEYFEKECVEIDYDALYESESDEETSECVQLYEEEDEESGDEFDDVIDGNVTLGGKVSLSQSVSPGSLQVALQNYCTCE